MLNYENLLVEKSDAVMMIRVNRPDKLNALNYQTLSDLHSAFKRAAELPEVRVIVLTGAGDKAFVAGADIAEMNSLSPSDALEFSRFGQALMLRIERMNKPVIGMVNGFALGGGMELAMACHLRSASENAKLGQPEINLGLIPGFGGTQRLLRLAGRSAAMELCLLGKPIDAQRAKVLGLVNDVVPADQLKEHTFKIAEKLSRSAPLALKAALDCILIAGEAEIEIGLDYESQAFGLMFSTDDKKEGSAAFLEKRKASFHGR